MDLVVHVVAPTGRDAELTTGFLRQNGIAAEPCKDLLALLRDSTKHLVGALLIAEEAIDARTHSALLDVLIRQPAWSDLPILILTDAMRALAKSSVNRFKDLGSAIVLERPIRPEALVSTIRAALKARQRQYQVRDTLAQRDEALLALKNEQETLRVVINNLPTGVVVTGPDGNVVMTNQNAEKILGNFLSGDTTTAAWVTWEAFHPAGQRLEKHEHPLWRAIYEAKTISAEEYLQPASDGQMHWIRVAAAPIIDGSGAVSGAVAALADIDNEKRAESALIKSEKLAAVGRLAASISHEINNPLEAVTNLLYLLEQSSRQDETTWLAIKAQQELARVSQIVTQTLRFHRQSSNPQPIAVKDLIEPTLALYRGRAANQNIKLEVDYRANVTIVCLEGDLRQVFNNLLGNAIDAMRAGGRLIVRTSIAHDFKRNVPRVRVSIADTGHGIPTETIKHIFEPFYTTKGINGSGLGLWISQEIMARSKGTLRIRSKAAQNCGGTVASVFLPTGTAHLERHLDRAERAFRRGG